MNSLFDVKQITWHNVKWAVLYACNIMLMVVTLFIFGSTISLTSNEERFANAGYRYAAQQQLPYLYGEVINENPNASFSSFFSYALDYKGVAAWGRNINYFYSESGGSYSPFLFEYDSTEYSPSVLLHSYWHTTTYLYGATVTTVDGNQVDLKRNEVFISDHLAHKIIGIENDYTSLIGKTITRKNNDGGDFVIKGIISFSDCLYAGNRIFDDDLIFQNFQLSNSFYSHIRYCFFSFGDRTKFNYSILSTEQAVRIVNQNDTFHINYYDINSEGNKSLGMFQNMRNTANNNQVWFPVLSGLLFSFSAVAFFFLNKRLVASAKLVFKQKVSIYLFSSLLSLIGFGLSYLLLSFINWMNITNPLGMFINSFCFLLLLVFSLLVFFANSFFIEKNSKAGNALSKLTDRDDKMEEIFI